MITLLRTILDVIWMSIAGVVFIKALVIPLLVEMEWNRRKSVNDVKRSKRYI